MYDPNLKGSYNTMKLVTSNKFVVYDPNLKGSYNKDILQYLNKGVVYDPNFKGSYNVMEIKSIICFKYVIKKPHH